MEGGGAYCSGDHDMGNLKATELRLGLPGSEVAPRKTKRALPEADEESQSYKRSSTSSDQDVISAESGRRETEPVAKAQVVGWPPVRSYRKNSFKAMKEGESTGGVLYVKVSMDGAPYLRKIDLKVYKGYKELREALEDKFKCFSLGEVSSGMEEFEYAITYEDKDGDWMLAGDVPWEMFICSCKRLRIMKGSEARGLSSST